MENESASFDVFQEFVSQTLSLRCAFNETRKVGHDKGTVSDLDHPKLRFQRRKRIVGDLRPGVGYDREQRRFAYGRKTYQPDVSQKLQFNQDISFLPRCSKSRIFRCAVPGRLEVIVSLAALSALTDGFLRIHGIQIGNDLIAVQILYNGP